MQEVIMKKMSSSMLSGEICMALIIMGGSLILLYVLWKVVLKPHAMKRAFEKQGVKCLPYHVWWGNLREISRLAQATATSGPIPLLPHFIGLHILPHYYHWKNTYGDFFVFWLGVRPIISISNPEHIKEILDDKFGHFPRRIFVPKAARNLVGDTVPSLQGQKWAQHRRIVGPAYFKEKLKDMTPTMVSCVSKMFDKWHNQMDIGKMEINVYEQFKVLTTNIIAHVACGSNSREADLVLKLQQEQKHLLYTSARSFYNRFLPSPCHRYALRLKREVETIISNIIARREYVDVGDDLLGILMEAAHQKEENVKLSIKDVVDEVKVAFVLGRETLSSLLSWTTMLLAINPEWQERMREEVLLLCGKDFPTHNALQNLKIVGMVLNEALRLYPPSVQVERETSKEIMLGNIVIPPNIKLWIPIIDLHYDPNLWGPDALEFNPERFSHGIGNACKTPSAFFPFSMGPHVCLGKNFALLEARVILTMMLQRFRFSLSPGYKHCPVFSLTLEPQHGMQIIFEKFE